MVKPLDFFQLFFIREMVESIVLHTNSFGNIHIASEGYKTYTRSDGSWQETTSEEIHRLIALLIYFGLVKLVGEVKKYWRTATLFHGLWARAIMPRLRFSALMAFLHIVDPLNEPAGNKLHEVEALAAKATRGVQGWRSGESTHLPPMWPGFDSQTRRLGVICGLSLLVLYSARRGFPRFPLSSKTNF